MFKVTRCHLFAPALSSLLVKLPPYLYQHVDSMQEADQLTMEKIKPKKEKKTKAMYVPVIKVKQSGLSNGKWKFLLN